MKISKVHIQNYRSLKDLEFEIDDYSIFIGPNGAGKSSVLHALDWFFNGRTLSSSDIYNYLNDEGEPINSSEEIVTNPDLETIRVTVTFNELSERDCEILQSYGKGSTAVFSKTWRLSENKEKYIGNAFQGPGFFNVRSKTRISDIREAYRDLASSFASLSDLGASPSKEDVLIALQAWENDTRNKALLVPINDADASHLFGFNGQNVLRDCITLILVPASCDMISNMTSNKKGSTLNSLIGSLVSNAGAAARQAWVQQNKSKIDELTITMRNAIDTSTKLQSDRINDRLSKLIPSATVEFSTTISDWIPNPSPDICTKVSIDGSQRDIALQGDGIQRALMIAMFESLIPDEKYVEGTYLPEKELSEDEARVELKKRLGKLPAILICIEEPEIYQHPVRARAFGKILYELSTQTNAQVIIATHSPYFVRPNQFASIRRFSLIDGHTESKCTTITEIATKSSMTKEKVLKNVELHLPTTFSEGFFSDKVALVEGATDKAVLEAIADKLGTPFDCKGVSILDISGKDGMRIPYLIFESLGTPTYIVIDGDSQGAKRKHPTDTEKQNIVNSSQRSSTEKVIAWMSALAVATVGKLPYEYGNPSIVTDKFSIWIDDIEEELSKWPSFCSTLSANGGRLRDEKNLQAYRQAVVAASLVDIPTPLVKCVEAILSF